MDKKDIEKYLVDVKAAVNDDRYRIERNANRQDNVDLFLKYAINLTRAKKIILSLKADDFSQVTRNKHKGYEKELLYIFGKDVKLLERIGNKEKLVHLYIKINKLDDGFVIIISFHEQKRPLKYYFK